MEWLTAVCQVTSVRNHSREQMWCAAHRPMLAGNLSRMPDAAALSPTPLEPLVVTEKSFVIQTNTDAREPFSTEGAPPALAANQDESSLVLANLRRQALQVGRG